MMAVVSLKRDGNTGEKGYVLISLYQLTHATTQTSITLQPGSKAW
jgi:hypothetical protein